MTYTGPGFVDYHAHLLRTSSGTPPPWGEPAGVRPYHEHCAAMGMTPVDALEEPEVDGLGDRLFAGLQRAAGCGLTEVWEAGVRHWAFLDALVALREQGPLPVRVRLLAAAGLAETGMRPRIGDPYLDLVGIKFYADGWLRPRTCALSREFLDEAGNTGILFEPADRLARRIGPFAEDGWSIATHAIGDRAIESALDAYELVYGEDCRAAAPRLEHVQVLHKDLVSRMAENGVVACIQPSFGVDDAADAHDGLGQRWPDAFRWSALLNAGVQVVAGSDYPIAELEPLLGLQKLLRNPFDHLGVDTAMDLMTDVRAGTVTLSADPRQVPADHLGDIEVLATQLA
ncbi:MAG TPA: amidohydrolase family protein [Streptosporangiaceae bacterium]|nr:amidohydrolase family protein [Streptosporangiaceae bacterium]